jgi:hypothetical protein
MGATGLTACAAAMIADKAASGPSFSRALSPLGIPRFQSTFVPIKRERSTVKLTDISTCPSILPSKPRRRREA